MIRRLTLSATLLLVACSSAPVAAPPPTVPAHKVSALPLEIHWVRNSAEYRAILEQSYRLAAAALARRVADREPGSWAVVIDADETLLDNSLQSKEHAAVPEEPFEEQWEAWVERREAPALPGARRFLEGVHGLGGRIAVVTNRKKRHCPQTADNLRAQRLPFDLILCRGEDRDKGPRWRSVEEGTADPALPPLEIVMWLGDNIHDFPGMDQALRFASQQALTEFGERFFILPNPMYGSWQDNPPD